MSPSVTWDINTRPKGFWDINGTWKYLRCQTSQFPRLSLANCLRNSHVYVIGDSNANRMYFYLVSRSSSKATLAGSWPRKAEAANKQLNITLQFMAHDYPLFLGQQWESLLRSGSVEKIIDGIPSTGRQLVILHYYLHLTPFHLSVAQSRLEAAARAISRLLARNPEARVAFRGPHVASFDYHINHAVGGDALGKQYLGLISTTFANLKDRVIFLDGWEMTTALENLEFHPDDKVPHEMVLMFLSFLCKDTI